MNGWIRRKGACHRSKDKRRAEEVIRLADRHWYVHRRHTNTGRVAPVLFRYRGGCYRPAEDAMESDARPRISILKRITCLQVRIRSKSDIEGSVGP